jgi:predicted dehydrogenase
MTDLRWGILSTAAIGRTKVIPAIQRAHRCVVVAIASRDRARGGEVAAELGIPRVHGSYDALLADPEVDAVYVPLPNHLHAEWSIEAARAGKHVLCEKPLALSVPDAERMIAAADEAGVLLMEAFMYRHHPSWVAARDLVRADRIGSLMAVQTTFSYFNDDPGNIRNILGAGGGALWDIGCYAINLSRMLFEAEPTRVVGSIRRDQSDGTDVVAGALLSFPGGGLASFLCSTRAEDDQRVDIYGTRGRINIEIPFNIPPDRPTRIHLAAGGDPPVAPKVETFTFEASDPYTAEAERFAAAALDGGPVPVPPRDAVANIRVVERIFASAAADATAADTG